MKIQEVERVCEQLVCSIFNFQFVFRFNKLYEHMIWICFGFMFGPTCSLCFIGLPYVGLNWNKMRLFGYWFWCGGDCGFCGFTLTVFKQQIPCLQVGFYIEELLCLVPLNQAQTSQVYMEAIDLVEIGQHESRMVLYLFMVWYYNWSFIRMKWCSSVEFFQLRGSRNLAQEVQQIWRGDINNWLNKSKAEALFLRRDLVIQYYMFMKVLYVSQGTYKSWYFLMFNRKRRLIICTLRGRISEVTRVLQTFDDQELNLSGVESTWLHGRGEDIFNMYILIGAVWLQWDLRYWFLMQIIYFCIMKYQFSVECSLVTQGFFTLNNLALKSFFKMFFYESIELEL